jgi:site-specific recombinase XerD
MGCKLKRFHTYEEVRVTEHSAKTVKLFFAVLKRFYLFAVGEGWYNYDDPLISHLAYVLHQTQVEALHALHNQHPLGGNGQQATATDPAWPGQTEPGMYFRLVRKRWEPRPIRDQDLPRQLQAAMHLAKLSLRDQIVVRILYEAGPRVSEVAGLTVGGWRTSQCRCEAEVRNKGSLGVLTKTVGFSSTTSRLLHRYMTGERRRLDPLRRSLVQLDDDDPVFLSHRRKPYSRAAFMPHWYRLCRAGGMRMRVHELRHWHVTQAMTMIYEQTHSAHDLALGKERLKHYMAWQSEETMRGYEHATQARDHLSRVLHPLHEKWNRAVRGVGSADPQATSSSHPAGSHGDVMNGPDTVVAGAVAGAATPTAVRQKARRAEQTSPRATILGRRVERSHAQRSSHPEPVASRGQRDEVDEVDESVGWGDLLP